MAPQSNTWIHSLLFYLQCFRVLHLRGWSESYYLLEPIFAHFPALLTWGCAPRGEPWRPCGFLFFLHEFQTVSQGLQFSEVYDTMLGFGQLQVLNRYPREPCYLWSTAPRFFLAWLSVRRGVYLSNAISHHTAINFSRNKQLLISNAMANHDRRKCWETFYKIHKIRLLAWFVLRLIWISTRTHELASPWCEVVYLRSLVRKRSLLQTVLA